MCVFNAFASTSGKRGCVYKRPDHTTPWYPDMPTTANRAKKCNTPILKAPVDDNVRPNANGLEIKGATHTATRPMQGIRTSIATTLAVVAKRVADASNTPDQAQGGSHVRLFVC